MEMMSPTRTSRPAFASWPFTTTRPASQVSLAKLRRKITRLHFKNKSRRIRSIGDSGSDGSDPEFPSIFILGDFRVFCGLAEIGISIRDPDKTVGA